MAQQRDRQRKEDAPVKCKAKKHKSQSQMLPDQLCDLIKGKTKPLLHNVVKGN